MKPKRVLVVEDESLVRALMVEVLAEAGFDVDEAGTVDEAHDKLMADGYGLIVTDIHTPGTLDGIDLARRVNSLDPGVPILIVTARPDVLDNVRGGDIHAHAMQKPFSFRELVDVARRLVGEA
jgi:DNA-binding response OmpR family regulator